MRKSYTNLNIPRPSTLEVERYLAIWDKTEKYIEADAGLDKLFLKAFPSNKNIDEVIIKVCALDVIYSANAGRWFIDVAKRIVELDIDDALAINDLSIVSKIAKVKLQNGKTRSFPSFASKYCSHHKPTTYPIYDSYVEKMLLHFRDKNSFCIFHKNDLKDFEKFRNILISFMKYYDLTEFDIKDIDVYLWQAGKKYFPQWTADNHG